MSNTPDTKVREAGEIARLLSYIVIGLVSAALFVSAGAIPTSRFETLGAGAFPRAVFGAIVLVAGIAIVDALRKIPRHAWGAFGAQTAAWVKRRALVFVCLIAFGVYILAIPVAGFEWASLVFVFGLQMVLMPRGPVTVSIALAVALVFSFGLNWLFAEGFTVFLPRGVF
ncbi:tripartite tricarboxylate transporter TctB family protein [Sagittula sp. SSi028]|uniref:tripartite tricarboxylate transporter TctB family protein n=1 Tax=Sagittula sp. SSi028 TaxID=3400636 RepID=UPI003AF7DB6C